MIALNQIKQDEGFVPHAYQDSEGYWTIGYGTLIDESLGAGITKEEAEYLLRNRVKIAEQELTDLYPWVTRLSPNRYAALTNMVYNLGIVRFGGFKKMLPALEAGDYETAADEAKDSKWYRQVKGRAVRICDIIRSG